MPSILLFVVNCFPDLAIGDIVFSRQIPSIGRYGAGILFQQVLALKCFASINRCSFTCVIPCVRIVLVFSNAQFAICQQKVNLQHHKKSTKHTLLSCLLYNFREDYSLVFTLLKFSLFF